MKLKNGVFHSILIVALTGCAHGPAVQNDLPNSLTAHINNDATGTMVMRGGNLYTFANEHCEAAEMKASKTSMNSQEALSTIPLTPGKPLTFALTTLNAQGFKGNWGCSVTATFTPENGKRYLAMLQTEGDNRTCRITLTDQDNRTIPTAMPDYSCVKTLAGTVKNGERHASTPYVPGVSVSR